MILDTADPIDLSHLLNLAPFSDDLDIAGAPPERRDDVRRGLCWLLSQDDDTLGDILRRSNQPSSPGDITNQRTQLDGLWQRTFADWRAGTEPTAPDQPPDLERLNQILAAGHELMALDLPSDTSVFDDPLGQRAIEHSLVAVLDGLYDQSEEEAEVRRALRWMLHQDDDLLSELLQRAEMIFPGTDITHRRRYLELVWDRAFADWRIPDPWREEYDIVGLLP